MSQRTVVVIFLLLAYVEVAKLQDNSTVPESDDIFKKEDVYEDLEVDGATNSEVIFFVFGGLAVGSILRSLIRVFNIPLPYRVIILFLGGAIGLLTKASPTIVQYVQTAHLSAGYILMIFLPPLMFKTAFCIDAHTFTRSWGQILLLAVPGLIFNAGFTGMIMMLLLSGGDWSHAMGMLFGILCSAVYPSEVVTLLSRIEQAKHLSILLEGEGMIGDGTTIILFQMLMGIIDGHIVTWYQMLNVFIRFSVGGVLFGLLCGVILTCIMGAMYNDVVNMSILTVVFSYLSYDFGGEYVRVSGLLTVVVVGIMASFEKTSLSIEAEHFLVNFWDLLSFTATTMVFLIAGVITAQNVSTSLNTQDCALILVTYIIATIGRLSMYLILAPLVSRIGYGLTFKNMTIAVWGGLRGPVPFCLALTAYHHSTLHTMGKVLIIHIAALETLTLCINATTMPILLRLLGLSEIAMARKVNMNNCMRHLCNRRDRTISMLKMDRFLADANWPLVHTATILKHPYKLNYDDSDEEEDNYFGLRLTVCPDCQKEIPSEPTNKEFLEMAREARKRILKAKKISYARQYENGMLSKEGIRILTQAVEVAMDTPNAVIELEGLHKRFHRQGFTHYARRKLLAGFFKKSESTVKPPRKYWRRMCYRIVIHSAFDIFMYCCVILNVIPITLEICLSPKSGTSFSTSLKIANSIFYFIYVVEFILKIYGYSWIYICKHGFKTYFTSCWNIFDFIVLVAATIDLIMDYVDAFSDTFNKSDATASHITLITKLMRVFRLLRLLRLCKASYPRLIRYCDSKIDKHLAFAYDIGKGFVTGEEEVSDMLTQMIDNKAIREDCRLRMEADRLAITKQLGLVQKDRPWIAITVKTRQAIRATLNSMSEEVSELKVSGWVDDVEYAMLMESLEERLKYSRNKVKSVQPSPPKIMFKEVPWLSDDEALSDFLYENVVTKVFDQGELVCVDGDMSDGIYIIVTGLFKLTYQPKRDTLDRLAEYGALPVMDYISSTRFEERVEDYIVSGNCIGELSVLTGRPYDCIITSDTSSQAYILTHDILKQAFQKSADPVNGLAAKMWKYISIRLATSILMDTPAYQSSTQAKIRYQLERSFVPNLSNYKIFGVNDMMQDIILIEGVVFDYNTRDCYTAPCYIPRTVQKIVLPKSSYMNFVTAIETKLLIIPARDVDEFDIMEREEDISEMVSTISSKCLQHVVQSRRKRKRQTIVGTGHRRGKYGGSKMSTTQSASLTRSRTTNMSISPDETELGNINMYDQEGNTFFENYVENERHSSQADSKTRHHSTSSYMDRRGSSRRPSAPPRHSLRETPGGKEETEESATKTNSKDSKKGKPEKLKAKRSNRNGGSNLNEQSGSTKSTTRTSVEKSRY